jgi:hypothetical protein
VDADFAVVCWASGLAVAGTICFSEDVETGTIVGAGFVGFLQTGEPMAAGVRVTGDGSAAAVCFSGDGGTGWDAGACVFIETLILEGVEEMVLRACDRRYAGRNGHPFALAA